MSSLLSWLRFFGQLLLLTLMLSDFSHAGHPDDGEGIVVDSAWLQQRLDDEALLIVDARKKSDYDKGHIPGAINLPVAKTFNPDKAKDRVGNLFHIRKLFSELGIRNDHAVVVYDDGVYIDAGRVFWVFEVYGHKPVYILNGGYPGWLAQAGTTVSKQPRTLPASRYIPETAPDILLTRLDMLIALDNDSIAIIDARTEEEYAGKESIAKRSGHIPGAVNIPWRKAFVEIDGIRMLRPTSELRKLYDPVAQGKNTIYTYCNFGQHASLTYTLLRQLGYNTAHYDGSWYEWGNDERLPIATTEQSPADKTTQN